MVDPQASRFWQAALRSDLVGAADLETWWRSVPPEKRTAEKVDRYLARSAVESGKLTLWQAQQLLNGRWQGLRLGKYVLRQLIGQGGMGRVYLAHDTRLGRPVAVKILSRQRTANPRALARFEREVRVGAKLQHENLIRIYDDGEAYGLRYLVMEYVEGKTLFRIIQEQGRLPTAIAAELARQVLMGLEHLHVKGLLHRDVNPSNILVDRSGTAKLTDLGLALDLDDPEVLTRDGAAVGTFDYIAPEQARNPRSIDIRCDIYALGCTLYHMLTGHVPFPGLNAGERIMAHQLRDPQPLPTLVPECPPGLAAAVHRMMRKVPEERFARPFDAARALAPFASGPVPLEQIGAPAAVRASLGMGMGMRGAATAVSSGEGGALAAEWLNSDVQLDPARARESAPITVTPDSTDVFPWQEADPEPGELAPPDDGIEADGDRRLTDPILVLVLAVLILLGLILGLAVWR